MPAQMFFRVDDRLVHGQVTVGWQQYLRFNAICIIDDTLAADPFLADVLRLSAPADVIVKICSVEQAAAALNELASGHILVLVKTPQTALALAQNGVALPHLNIGNVAAAPGRARVYRSISLGPAEVAALDALNALGVRITFQQTPDEAQVEWEDVKRKT